MSTATKTAQHTPGPWSWYWRKGVINKGEADCGVFSHEHEGMAVSVCRAPRFETKEQWEANARLIAAAPDLLDVAEKSLAYFKACLATNELPQNIADTHASQLRAAIQKAKGDL